MLIIGSEARITMRVIDKNLRVLQLKSLPSEPNVQQRGLQTTAVL